MASSSLSGKFSAAYRHSFAKFAVVGLIGVGVNEGLLILLDKSAGVSLLAAGAIAIEISILSNFVLNDLWTFKDRRTGNAAVRLAKFNALMLAGLVVNLVVLDVGTTYFGIDAAISNLVGIAAAFFLRYALSVKYAWMRVEAIEEGEPAGVEKPLAGPEAPHA
jgi:dolichol-phosphate mannosyltransferase